MCHDLCLGNVFVRFTLSGLLWYIRPAVLSCYLTHFTHLTNLSCSGSGSVPAKFGSTAALNSKAGEVRY